LETSKIELLGMTVTEPSAPLRQGEGRAKGIVVGRRKEAREVVGGDAVSLAAKWRDDVTMDLNFIFDW
jgi:hypothetical protein